MSTTIAGTQARVAGIMTKKCKDCIHFRSQFLECGRDVGHTDRFVPALGIQVRTRAGEYISAEKRRGYGQDCGPGALLMEEGPSLMDTIKTIKDNWWQLLLAFAITAATFAALFALPIFVVILAIKHFSGA